MATGVVIKNIRDIIISKIMKMVIATTVITLLGLCFSSIGNIMPQQY
jgi:hypothetical protein